jgi:DNA repair exonuclease SbcCD ATPase subunit
MRYRLKHLKVAAFRGACDEVSVPLDKPLVVLYGPNGAGKSTLLTAIEWVLFPKEATLLKEHDIRERTDWEVRHVHGNEDPCVRLTLNGGSEDIVIEHTESKKKKKGGRPSDPRTSLNCAYADFKGLAYIHQETIRDFLIGRATPREEAFQRLLGAGWIQDLAEAIDGASKKLGCDEADQRVDALNTQIDARMQEAKRTRDEKENAARQAGLKEPWEEAADTEVGNVDTAIKAICGQFGIDAPALPESRPLEGYSERLRPILQNMRGQGPAKTHTDLSTRKTNLELARGSYSVAQDAVNNKRGEVQRTEPGVGTREELSQKTAAHKERRDELQSKIDNLSRERSVIRVALEYFKTSPDATGCPACQRDGVPDGIVTRLGQRLEAESTAQENKVGEELKGAKNHLKTLESLAEQWQGAEETLSKQRGILETALGRKMRVDEAPLHVVDAEIDRLKSEIGKLTQTVQDLQNSVTEIEKNAKRVDAVGEIVSLQLRVDTLGEIRRTTEWGTMTQELQALSRRELGLEHASHAVKQMAVSFAQQNLDRARQPITNVYRELTRRSDFPDISIDAQRKYAIEVSGESGIRKITAVLNQTDLDALAIAVVVGMATTFPEVHNLDFLILDDPSQGMDPEVTSRLAEVINTISEKIQVIVAAPNSALLEELKKSTRVKKVIELKARDSESRAPCVQLQSVSGD